MIIHINTAKHTLKYSTKHTDLKGKFLIASEVIRLNKEEIHKYNGRDQKLTRKTSNLLGKPATPNFWRNRNCRQQPVGYVAGSGFSCLLGNIGNRQ